jgi:hypothetical protein
MIRTKLLAASLVSITLISLLHHAALHYHWYFTHRWIDIVMHVLGGFWIAVSACYFAIIFMHDESVLYDKKHLARIIFVAVFIVGTIWEFFEFFSGNTFLHTANFWTDTISDMINNFIGGAFVYLYVILKKK